MLCVSCGAENGPTAEACFTCGRGLCALTQGAVLSGRYEVQSFLGQGAMGTVYRAYDRALEETIAIKVLRSGASPEYEHRLRSEIKLARKIRHRHVCAIHEYGEDHGLRYIAMEYVDGFNLRQLIEQCGALPAAEALDLAIQVLGGLQAVHDTGIIHRDLKSPNIMRDSGGVVRLMDFGMARHRGDDVVAATAIGAVLGTPEYMSPEQARGERADFATDIYSMGIVLYELLAGHVPFQGPTLVATILKHLQEPPPLSGPDAALIPAPMMPILWKALAKDPAERYATPRGMAAAIRLARSRLDTGPAPAWLQPDPALGVSALPSLSDSLGDVEPPAPESILALSQALREGDTDTRWRVARTLGACGTLATDSVISALVEALEDPDFLVAEAATRALRRLAGSPAAPDPSPRVVPALPSPRVTALLEVVQHGDAHDRWQSALALGEMGSAASPSVVQALIERLEDTDESVRWEAVTALGKIGAAAAGAVPALAAVLTSPFDPATRRCVAMALGRIGSPARDAVPALIGALALCDEAAEALIQIGSPSVPALIEAVAAQDEQVRWKAASALTRIAIGPRPGGALAGH
jgi:serine/threonine protein kinase